jgi:predicted PhzF superfamily epimerase YddE/YHI9
LARFRDVVAFTDTPLQGNHVAVFTDAREIPDDRLQALAREKLNDAVGRKAASASTST